MVDVKMLIFFLSALFQFRFVSSSIFSLVLFAALCREKKTSKNYSLMCASIFFYSRLAPVEAREKKISIRKSLILIIQSNLIIFRVNSTLAAISMRKVENTSKKKIFFVSVYSSHILFASFFHLCYSFHFSSPFFVCCFSCFTS